MSKQTEELWTDDIPLSDEQRKALYERISNTCSLMKYLADQNCPNLEKMQGYITDLDENVWLLYEDTIQKKCKHE